MSELPSGWASAAIGELCTLENGRAFKSTEWGDRGLPIVRIQNLNSEAASFNHFDGEVADRYRLKGGELLFAWSGTPGTSFGAHVWRGGDAVLNQHIFRVDFNESVVDRRFFRHAINQKLVELIDVAHGGVGLRHVTKGVFEKTMVLVPPLPEQRRIADMLDVLLARISVCRERLDRVHGTLKRFRQSVLTSATNGGLTLEWREERGLVNEWVDSQVEEIASVGTGTTPARGNSTFYSDTGTPWITSAMTGLPFVDRADQFVTDAAIAAHRLRKYPIGTLLVAMYGEGKTRGQVTELRIEATVNQACAAILVDQRKATTAFVRLALEANYLRMRELAEGGNQPNLNLSKVKNFPLSLPPLDEQRAIAERVAAFDDWLGRTKSKVEAAHSHVEHLTNATLAKAFRGELVPQDPTDEPADKLLARLTRAHPIANRTKVARKAAVRKIPRSPKESALMSKSRQDNDVKDMPYLAGHIHALGGSASVEALFKASELPVADFYKQLAWEVDQGLVKDRQDTLEASDAA